MEVMVSKTLCGQPSAAGVLGMRTGGNPPGDLGRIPVRLRLELLANLLSPAKTEGVLVCIEVPR